MFRNGYECDAIRSKLKRSMQFNMLGTEISIILWSRIRWTHLSSSSSIKYRHGFRIRGTYSLIHNKWYEISFLFSWGGGVGNK